MRDRAVSGAECPDIAELLLASEGELSKRRLIAVREHVRRCATCRDRLGDTEGAIDAYADDLAGAPPSPAEIDASLARHDVFSHLLRAEQRQAQRDQASVRSVPSARSWLPVAAAVPLLVIGLLFTGRYTTTVKADELITRAVARQQSEPKTTVQRVQIRFTPAISRSAPAGRLPAPTSAAMITREIGEVGIVPAQASPLPVETMIAQILAAHSLDLAHPLSVARFQAWRSSLPQKRDRVEKQDSERLLALTTTTDEGQLRSAQLVVRQDDYHPVRQTLTFDDFGQVEIAEVATWVVATPPSAPALSAARTDGDRAASAASPTAAEIEADLNHSEVIVRSALHRLGVDVDDAVAIRRSADQRLVVAGVVGSAARKAQVIGELRGLPRTSVQLVAADQAVAKPAMLPDSPTAIVVQQDARPALLAAWLEKTFPDASSQQAYGATALRQAQAARARALAWERLAARYSDAELARLTDSDREVVRALFASDRAQIKASLEALDHHLSVLWQSLGGDSRATMTDDAADDGSAAAVVAAAQRIDQQVLELFADVDADVPPDTRSVADRVQALRAQLAGALQRLDRAARLQPSPGT